MLKPNQGLQDVYHNQREGATDAGILNYLNDMVGPDVRLILSYLQKEDYPKSSIEELVRKAVFAFAIQRLCYRDPSIHWSYTEALRMISLKVIPVYDMEKKKLDAALANIKANGELSAALALCDVPLTPIERTVIGLRKAWNTMLLKAMVDEEI